MLCEITAVNTPGGPSNELPGGGLHPGGGPIIPPPFPGIWPPPGEPNRPIDPGFGVGLPPHIGGGPIVIPEPPGSTLPMPPPGTIWPPLPPDLGLLGKYIVLILVLGVGYRWLVVDAPGVWPPPLSPTPK